jgi:hypothetical protein
MADRADYEAVLADLRAKKQEIEATIAALERFLGVMGMPAGLLPVSLIAAEKAGKEKERFASAYRKALAAKPYRRLTIKQAASKYLEAVRLKQTPRQIASALAQGGLVNKSKDFPNTVRSTLSREPEFVKIGNEWALRSWYPSQEQPAPAEAKQVAAQ